MNDHSYPPIDPTTFDLIIVGTGLPESTIAAASSAAGKSVLHLDPNSFYGTHFSSLSLHDFPSFIQATSSSPPPPPPPPPPPHPSTASSGSDFVAVDLKTRCLYSNFEISIQSPEVLEQSTKFCLDLAGPRVLFCADSVVDVLLRSGANQYIEFKSVDASFVYDENRQLSSVLDSREAIFKDRSLRLTEKNQLMRFYKLVQNHIGSADSDGSKISDEDLASPFVDFLTKMRLPPKIKSIILYAIALADYDQDNVEVCKDVVKTKDGIDRLALYHSSVGRYPNALGAMIYPLYGQGELPQAFCRRAAVKGCIYVLRMPVTSVLVDKYSGHYKGVRLASGQDLFSHQLVLNPSLTIHMPSVSSPFNSLQEGSPVSLLSNVKGKVARGVCITSSSLKLDVTSLLLVYPPRSLFPEQATSIRVLQIASNLAICPSGLSVVYLSTLCDDADQGKKLLRSALTSLFTPPPSDAENESSVQSEETEVKPSLLWSALYIQELATDSFESIISTPLPDANLTYKDLFDETFELFKKMYPHEDFFPEATTPSTDETENDIVL